MAFYDCERLVDIGFEYCEYVPNQERKLLAQIPNKCKTEDFLWRLKHQYGFSLLMVGLEQIDQAIKAGWKTEELVLWVCCGASVKEVENAIKDPVTQNLRRFHSVYVDEPLDDPKWFPWGNQGRYPLMSLAEFVRDDLKIPFIIGEYNRMDNNRWKTILNLGIPACIVYSGYRDSDWWPFRSSDQRNEWDLIYDQDVGCGVEWINVIEDHDELDSLFGYANDHKFSELWAFANLDEPCSVIEYYLQNFLNAAKIKGWLTKKCNYISKWRKEFCIYEDCSKCDKNNPDHWSRVPMVERIDSDEIKLFLTRDDHFFFK